jgi:hypothetical protein
VAEKVAEKLKQLNESRDTKMESIQHIKAKLEKFLMKEWENKMNDQYVRSRGRLLIKEEDAFLYLSKGDLKEDNESEIIAAQDRVLQTKYYVTIILQTKTGSKHRISKRFVKTTEHTIPACPILAKKPYIKRHNRVCAQLHLNINKEIGVKLDNEQWYDHVSKSVETRHKGGLPYFETKMSDPKKLTITNRENKNISRMLKDVAISGDRNIMKKVAEKILKYKDLITEIQCMWNKGDNKGNYNNFCYILTLYLDAFKQCTKVCLNV